MSLLRLLFRRRYSTNPYPFHSPYPYTPQATDATLPNHPPNPNTNFTPNQTPHPYPNTNFTPNQFSAAPNHSQPESPANSSFTSQRSYGFSSAEEAAAERRRRKRRLRIEPPLYALRPNPQTPPPSDENTPEKPRLPDSTSALVGPRLNLHNRVQALIRADDLDAASYVARQAVYQRVRPTVFTCNAIIGAMYRSARYDDAKALFIYFFRQFSIIPNIVSYNHFIVSLCLSNEIEEALEVYKEIVESAPFGPSSVTYRHLTKGLVDAGRMDDAVGFLREMLHKGQGADSLVYNNVILGYLNLGELDKANELFNELKERCTVYDGVVNATFMDWFFNQGRPKEAMDSYKDLLSRAKEAMASNSYKMVPATRNVLLETLLKHGKKKEAWDLFHVMLDEHTLPTFHAVNAETFNIMVNECFEEGKIEEAMDVFKRIGKGPKSKPFNMDVAGYNNMIMRLCEREMMNEAEQYYMELMDKSVVPDVSTFRTLIDAYIKVDRVEQLIEKYSKMVELGLRVIPPYANKWFGFMIQKGKSSDCLPLLSKMADREPKPDITTYDIVIRGLVEEGNYDPIANVLRQMMTHGVGTTNSLKEFVLDVFEGLGRRVEVENIFHMSHQSPYQGPSTARPSEMVEQGGRPQASSYANQYTQQTGHAQQYTQQTGHANQYTQQTGHANQYTQQTGHANQYTQQTGHANQYTQQTGHANQYTQQTGHANQYMQQTGHANQYMQQTGHANQYTQQTGHASQYTQQTSHANQYTQQPGHANQYTQQTGHTNQYAQQTGHATQYTQQTTQPQMTQQMGRPHSTPEPEFEYRYATGQNGA